MKGDPKVIELLNEALKEELTAINQYWLHYRMLDNWGVKALAEYERHESIDEMKHADRLAERILFLDGLPNFQALGRLRIGENVEEILKADMEAEQQGAKLYRDVIAHARIRARLCHSRSRSRNPLRRGKAHRLHRDAVRIDRAHGSAELHPAAVQAGRGIRPDARGRARRGT